MLKYKEVDVAEFHLEPLPDSPVGEDTVIHIKPISEALVKSERIFKAPVLPDFHKVGSEHIAYRDGRGLGVAGRNVWNSVMDHPVFFISGFIVGGYFTGLEAPAHIDADIDDHRTFFHVLHHGA